MRIANMLRNNYNIEEFRATGTVVCNFSRLYSRCWVLRLDRISVHLAFADSDDDNSLTEKDLQTVWMSFICIERLIVIVFPILPARVEGFGKRNRCRLWIPRLAPRLGCGACAF